MITEWISFFSGILGVGLITCLYPNRQKINSVLKLLTSLLVLGAIASPLQSFLSVFSLQSVGDWMQNAEDAYDYEAEWKNALQEGTSDYLEEILCNYLQNRYEIAEGEIDCVVRTSSDGKIEKVSLILSGKAIWKDPSPMEKEIAELFNCPCESLIA